MPPDDNAARDEVKKLVNRFQYGVEHFEPVNRPVWDALFMDWHTEQLREVYSSCKEKMRAALVETDEKKQEQYLYDAICGKYYEKFACMCGMLYLAGQWEKYGIPGLKTAFTDYHGFAERTLDEI